MPFPGVLELRPMRYEEKLKPFKGTSAEEEDEQEEDVTLASAN